ncbi:MAG: DUF1622 domain-containing protein [Hyphomicrobiales bacterium]
MNPTAYTGEAETVRQVQSTIDAIVHLVGSGIEVFGVAIIVLGILLSTLNYMRASTGGGYDAYKIAIGRSLLLGLEVLVAADIVKTVATELTFTNLGELAALVVIRTFLTWALVLEIEGRWPWQRDPAAGEERRTSP